MPGGDSDGLYAQLVNDQWVQIAFENNLQFATAGGVSRAVTTEPSAGG